MKDLRLSDKAEEILEALWIQLVEQERPAADLSAVRDPHGTGELLRHGLVSEAEAGLVFTPRGREEGSNCVRRHRLAERLLHDVLSVNKPLLHESGCVFEHLLHRGVEESVCTLLGHPRTCPHGRAIPEGACCREARRHTGRLIVPLSELEPDTEGTVAYLRTEDRTTLHKLITIGILPSTPLVLLQRFPTIVIEVGRSQFAIDEALASHVYVRCGRLPVAKDEAAGHGRGWPHGLRQRLGLKLRRQSRGKAAE